MSYLRKRLSERLTGTLAKDRKVRKVRVRGQESGVQKLMTSNQRK
ncbi:hypothetical protein BTTAP_30027 [Brochothrix thermosphacta]|uniref:Uncharacterized protein n=1 Tax=Brochothrix thermosphacta TaxID=2756 RepID=A0A2X0QLZ0_BROTH|nr:hypothetical protein BTBSAS_250022 [Brochothrix thermosphacta]SPP29153.1 hypothetical protein BTTAP_30027 [Brochothrix thermosphacta]